MDKITTTIKREWLRTIANRTKRVEYREIKPYRVKTPLSSSGALPAPTDQWLAAECAGSHRGGIEG